MLKNLKNEKKIVCRCGAETTLINTVMRPLPTVSVFTLGCKVNQYESDVIVDKLKKLNYDASAGLKKADIFILNTCAVTSEAERKSRQSVARAKKLNPDAKIIVLGCAAERDAKQFLSIPGVAAVGGNSHKFAVEKYLSDTPQLYESDLSTFENSHEIAVSKVRQTIKVQDGCNRFCSYCIIPYIRGRSRSRDLSDIKNEAEFVLAQGVKEIVLTGIDLSSYGDDTGSCLSELINELSSLSVRIRLGSLEISAVTGGLLSALKECKNFCPHFHLSLQSGSDEVLKKMNRRYSTDEFLEVVKKIRAVFPDAAITTDVIVGFPFESEQNFNQTVAFVKAAEFADIHIFPYSKREGTAAAKMKQVASGVKKQRIEILSDVKNCLKEKFLEKQRETVASVLVESFSGGYFNGHAENYVKVYIGKEYNCLENEIIEVKLTERIFDGMAGIPVSNGDTHKEE